MLAKSKPEEPGGRRLLLGKLRYWPPELRAVAVAAYCNEHAMETDTQWRRYEAGWFHVKIERFIVVLEAPELSVGTGEVK